MAMRISTGLANKLLDTDSAKAILEGASGFFIDIYTGSRPASANTAPTGTKLVRLYSNGTSAGLHFETTAVDGELVKETTETWTGTVLATGVAGWFRILESTDDGSTSTTLPRADGSVSTTGADMNMSSVNLTAGAIHTLPAFKVSILGG